MLFLLVRVDFLVLVRNPAFLESDPSPLDVRAELHWRSISGQTHVRPQFLYPAGIEYQFLRVLVLLDRLHGVASRGGEDLDVGGRHGWGEAEQVERALLWSHTEVFNS